MNLEVLHQKAIELLKDLISTPSPSTQEADVLKKLAAFLTAQGITTHTHLNNLWCCNKFVAPDKPTLLLNSHLDTVTPSSSYTFDPYHPFIKDGKLYGLGSNDAGGALTALTLAFCYLYDRSDLPYNLVLAATAEEENSGDNGLKCLLESHLPPLDFAIVGEPTQMRIATAEKGLMVIECVAHGRSSHAARDGTNAIILAMQDIQWINSFQFPKTSALLGPIKMTVTKINAGTLHNIIPGTCTFYVDIRLTECYTCPEVLAILQQQLTSTVNLLPGWLNPSVIDAQHPWVQKAIKLGFPTFASPTTSDQALLTIPSVKLGPGKSERSHTADEFIFLQEIKEGIAGYISLITENCAISGPG